MTWKELQTATLAKMFSAQNGVIDATSSNNIDYGTMMIDAANEGIQYIASLHRPRKSVEVDIEKSDTAQAIVLKDVATGFYSAQNMETYLLDGEVPVRCGLEMIAGRLIIPAQYEGTLIVYYDAIPKLITDETEDDDKIDLPTETVVFLPLYVASQLYKDEDIQIATTWRNEFETAIEAVGNRVDSSSSDWGNTTGWW